MSIFIGNLNTPISDYHYGPSIPSYRYLLMGTVQLPLAGFLGALHSLGEKDMDVDEVQCILANLIDKVMDDVQ